MSSQVKSELYTETNFETEKTSNGSKVILWILIPRETDGILNGFLFTGVLSKFIYSLPSSFVEGPEVDEDGDLILSRIAKGSILIGELLARLKFINTYFEITNLLAAAKRCDLFLYLRNISKISFINIHDIHSVQN